MNINVPLAGPDNSYWQAQLRETPGLKHCPLPKDIEFSGDQNEAYLRPKSKSLQSNMQGDSAAFDAWALALLAHCGVKKINIEVEREQQPSKPHFQRFLYRAHRFAELFPVRGNFTQYESRALDERIVKLLNQPEPRVENGPEAALKSIKEKGLKLCSESNLEIALSHSEELERAFNLNKLMRQWPVGLFAGEVKRGKEGANLIFTGGKSAIDLIGISGDTLVLFELKKSNNRKAGILSELLFYANVMRDAIRGRFAFGQARPTTNKLLPSDILACRRIRAIILAPDFHPLVWNDKTEVGASVLSNLNAAVRDKWKIPTTFEAVQILEAPSSLGTDFKFRTRFPE